ncbi:MAG: chaperonin GroEL [Planctomycetes bacterium]|nr:chaperonin GroEL [Planctomycetota bacterium]
MAKQLMFDDAAWRKVHSGVQKLATAVKVTLGPAGRVVILDKKWGSPGVTKDGVTVSKEVELEDPFENMGAKLVNEVASKTSDVAGDGTTTATVLAEAIFGEGVKALAAKADPMALKRGLDKCCEALVAEIDKQSRPVRTEEEIAQVATISANQDEELGKLVASAVQKVGKDGVITVEEAKSLETKLELVDGMAFDKGFISPYFVNKPEKMMCVLENARILIYEKKIGTLRELIPILEGAHRAGAPLLIIAEDIENEALAALVVNRLRGILNVCAVKAPGFGDRRKAMLGDIATLTGAEFISADIGTKLEDVTFEHLGTAKRIEITKDSTTIIEGAGSKAAISDRIAQIRRQMDLTTSDYDKEKLQERLAKLAGGVAILKVGAATEAESKEKKARVEDAVHATRAATDEGVVPGGGVALLRASLCLEDLKGKLRGDEKFAVGILTRALQEPARAIATNAGEDGAVVVDEILTADKAHWGYDARRKVFCDMVKAGIVDPAKVTKSALLHAVSVSGTMLTTRVMVTELKDKDRKKAIAGAVA